MSKRYALAVIATLWGFAAVAQGEDTETAASEPAEAAETEISASEADLAAAETIFNRNCRACHGNKAQGVASYPKLSDKTAAYIAEKLEIYRAGERVGPNSVLMIQNARDLTDEEIAGLSVYVTTAFE